MIVGALLALADRVDAGQVLFQIILPGTMVGLIVGFATQKYGKSPAPANS